MRHVMTEVWHNYFLDPGSAPDPDPAWLAGCSAEAMIKTDRAVSREQPDALERVSGYQGPVLVLYGAYDIFGVAATEIVRRRFPRAVQMTRGLRSPALAAESFRLCERTPAVLPPRTALPPVATGPGGFPDGLPESERRRLDAPKRWPRAYRGGMRIVK